MYGYIYKITSLVTGKSYIGKHKYHLPVLDEKYVTSGTLIRKAISKYGLESFSRELIAVADSLDELNQKEKSFIKEYNTLSPNGYNLTTGGDGVSEPTPEILEANRLKHLGKKQSAEVVRRRVESTRKTVALKSEDELRCWRQKISEKNKNQKVSDYQKQMSSKRHKDTNWYNDGQSEFMLKPEEVWPGLVRGRLKNPFPSQLGCSKKPEAVLKTAQKLKGSSWFNDGISERLFKKTDNIPEGFVKGRLRVRI